MALNESLQVLEGQLGDAMAFAPDEQVREALAEAQQQVKLAEKSLDDKKISDVQQRLQDIARQLENVPGAQHNPAIQQALNALKMTVTDVNGAALAEGEANRAAMTEQAESGKVIQEQLGGAVTALAGLGEAFQQFKQYISGQPEQVTGAAYFAALDHGISRNDRAGQTKHQGTGIT